MDRQGFQRLLEQKAFPTVLLFEGEEEYLKQQALAALRQALLPPGMEELNENLLTAPETDEIQAAAETLPFMAEKRLVLVRDLPALAGRAEADEKLLAWLPQCPDTAVVLFYCTAKPDGRKKLYTTIKKLNGIVTFSPMKDRELTTFVTRAFHDQGRECDERTAEYLIFTCGTDSTLLMNEIAKIAAHGVADSPVTVQEITELATPSIECTVFQMVDAVVSRQNARALRLVKNQLTAGADRLYLLAMLLRQFRLLQHIKIMQFEKRGNDFIRASLGMPPFVCDQYVKQAAACSNHQVKQAVAVCMDTEYRIKSGRMNQEGALEAAVLKILTQE